MKERIAIDITSEKISILVGTRYKIAYSILIETPKGAYEKDEIIDGDAIKKAIEDQLGKGRFRTKSKEVAFVVRGEDLIVRHITLPQMKDAAVKDSVEWELAQFVGERADEYTVSYEVISGKAKNSEENIEVLMVAAENNKVKKYLQLGKELGLEVVGLDIASNISVRMSRAYQKIYVKNSRAVGFIDLSGNTSSFTIVERGRHEMEKYLNFGLMSASPEVIKSSMAYSEFLYKIDFSDERDFTSGRLQTYLDNITSQFNEMIQFYTSGKVKKTLDKIYLMGSCNQVKGLEKVFEETFNTSVEFIPEFDDLKFSVKKGKKIFLKDYFYNYGLILRTDKNEINLIGAVDVDFESSKNDKTHNILLAILVILVLIGGIAAVKAREIYLGYRQTELTEELARNKSNIEINQKLKDDISLLTQHIEKTKSLETIKTKETDILLKALAKEFPAEIKVSSITYDKSSIVITGSAAKEEDVEKLWANLRESDKFTASFINGISGGNFTVTITLKGGSENGQAS